MDEREFWEWLETCPTHKWETLHHDVDHVIVTFPIVSMFNDEEEDNA